MYALNPLVAIVILNWNGRHFLQRFLPSVMATSYSNHQVVVADNASTDDSVAWLQQHYRTVKIIRLEQNYGFAKGYNEALRQIGADYFILLNSDVEVSPGWVEPVIGLMEADHRIAACQPKICMEKDRSVFEYAGASGGWIDGLGYAFARGRLFDVCEADHGQYDDTRSIFWASGCAMFVRASAWRESGGLDNYFFAHMEEIDLCWRLQLAGYRIMVCPESVVYHVGGGTLPKGNQRKLGLNFRNNLIMLWKNMPWQALLWKFPVRLLLDALVAWKSLLTGEPAYFVAVVKAHVGFVYWLLAARKGSVWPVSRQGRLEGVWKGSIVWAYFVRGKRKFSEIMGSKPV